MCELSKLSCKEGTWHTSPLYTQSGLAISLSGFLSVSNLLLERPNFNSTHLFRADILADSSGELKTTEEIEGRHKTGVQFNSLTDATLDGCSLENREESRDGKQAGERNEEVVCRPPHHFDGFQLMRTVLRNLVPRKPQLDRPLKQFCYFYRSASTSAESVLGARDGGGELLMVYVPVVNSKAVIPWYHPPVQALAYLYEAGMACPESGPQARLSIHFLPFEDLRISESMPLRLHRTLISLLQTFIRLAKNNTDSSEQSDHKIPRDNIIPQHLVQNTYTRLKQKYASELISKWVEKTEPSKHVFEDLSIAAFLIELWRQMYGTTPICERAESLASDTASARFPGFIDLACGNGVLVFILHQEGYRGCGLDARARRTWTIFPDEVQNCLHEALCIPQPFWKAAAATVLEAFPSIKSGDVLCNFNQNMHTTSVEEPWMCVHNGIFPLGSFIISNHADELTPWTPILAALSNPHNPLPWLAIPCCSHALSGAKHRYAAPKHAGQAAPTEPTAGHSAVHSIPDRDDHDQPCSGDIKVLRAQKEKAVSGADKSSTYASLTAKVIALADELGFEVEKTFMRIPSTRNIGILGNRRYAAEGYWANGKEDNVAARKENPASQETTGAFFQERISTLVGRECRSSGGVEAAAQIWIEHAHTLQIGQGRGKCSTGHG